MAATNDLASLPQAIPDKISYPPGHWHCEKNSARVGILTGTPKVVSSVELLLHDKAAAAQVKPVQVSSQMPMSATYLTRPDASLRAPQLVLALAFE